MKKAFLVEAAIILAVIAVFFAIKSHEKEYETFDIARFESMINDKNCQSDVVFGEVPDRQSAADCADALWSELYGTDVLGEKIYVVEYEENEHVWWVYSKPRPVIGGNANILIAQETGEVLAVWWWK